MDEFQRARGELYGFLYRRFTANDGPYCGRAEFDAFCASIPQAKAALLFARDMGHIKTDRLGSCRLTAQGVLYAEEISNGD